MPSGCPPRKTLLPSDRPGHGRQGPRNPRKHQTTKRLRPPKKLTQWTFTAQPGRNQKKKADHVHDHVYVDVDVIVNGSCHAKILSRRTRIFGLVVRRSPAATKSST